MVKCGVHLWFLPVTKPCRAMCISNLTHAENAAHFSFPVVLTSFKLPSQVQRQDSEADAGVREGELCQEAVVPKVSLVLESKLSHRLSVSPLFPFLTH